MSSLDRFLPDARHVEVDHADVAASAGEAYRALRDLDLGRSPFVRALFWLRTLPEGGGDGDHSLRIDAIVSHAEGFRMLEEVPGESFTVGSIGRYWHPNIEWHEALPDTLPDTMARFSEPGWGKIVWQVRVEPRGPASSRIAIELRIGATDDDAWRAFRRYYALIGPFSHLIRRHALAMLQRELGLPEVAEQTRPLPGDELVPEQKAQITHGIDIEATPAEIWPWLVQMGCRRAGWYSHDRLDNAGVESAREIHPEWQSLRVGDVIPATPDDREGQGFRVLRLDPERVLVLGGTFDLDGEGLVPEGAPRPARHTTVSWAFVLEPQGERATRLVVRVRLDFAPERVGWRALGMGVVHHFMESAQLRHLKERIESVRR